MEELMRLIKNMERKIERLETSGEQPAFVPLFDHAPSSTITGWSSYSSANIWVTRKGKRVDVIFFIEGTSNSGSTSFTLPYTNRNSNGNYVTVATQCMDNGSLQAAAGLAQMAPNSDVVTCYLTFAGGGWTSSGGKRVAGQLTYFTT